MPFKKRQSGLTFISWIFVLMIVGFFVLLTLKLVPIYLENQSVKSIVKSLENDASIRKMTAKGIRKIIKRRMKINSIYDFPKENIKIKKSKNRLIVDITYDKIEPIIANVSVLVSFSEIIKVEIIP